MSFSSKGRALVQQNTMEDNHPGHHIKTQCIVRQDMGAAKYGAKQTLMT